ncbi:MAG: hypothetical protein ACLFO1_09815 [Spirochaetaceae bacterium]
MTSNHGTSFEHDLRKAAVSFSHDEIDARYDLAALESRQEIRDKNLLEGIGREDIDNIKQFVQEVMYPPVEERERRDQALHTLTHMLTDPANLISFFPSVPRIAFTYGLLFPEAIRAGRDVLRAYHTSRELEDALVDELSRRLEQPRDAEEVTPSHDEVRRAFASLSLDPARRLVDQVRRVVEHGKRRRLMDATIDILTDLKKSSHDRGQADAVDYIIGVISHVRRLAKQYTDDQIGRLIRLAEIVENDYLDEIAEAA